MTPLLSFKDFMVVNYVPGQPEIIAYNTGKRHIEEDISPAERLKRRLRMKRNRIKLKIARKRALRKPANIKTLQKRARNAARRSIQKRLLKSRSKRNLSAAAKNSLEKRIASRPALIKAMTRKLLPGTRRRDISRRRNKR